MKKSFGFALIEMLISLAIIAFLVYIFMNFYSGPRTSLDTKDNAAVVGQSNIDTTNYKTISDSARKSVEDINKRSMDRIDQLDEAVK